MMRALRSMMTLWNAFVEGENWNRYPLSYGDIPPDPWSHGEWHTPGPARAPYLPGPSLGFTPVPPGTYAHLNGVWRGNNGEILALQGGRFRIQKGPRQYVDGTYLIRGSRFLAYCCAERIPRSYRLAVTGDMLVLRDERGQHLVFRRVQPRFPLR